MSDSTSKIFFFFADPNYYWRSWKFCTMNESNSYLINLDVPSQYNKRYQLFKLTKQLIWWLLYFFSQENQINNWSYQYFFDK